MKRKKKRKRRKRQPSLTGENWSPPVWEDPDMPPDLRDRWFEFVVDTSEGEVFDMRRWADYKPENQPSRPEPKPEIRGTVGDWDGTAFVMFGKHKGTAWADVDDQYLEWMLSTDDGNPWWQKQKGMAEAELLRRQEAACDPLDAANLSHLRELSLP